MISASVTGNPAHGRYQQLISVVFGCSISVIAFRHFAQVCGGISCHAYRYTGGAFSRIIHGRLSAGNIFTGLPCAVEVWRSPPSDREFAWRSNKHI
ncbi:hypothetical protein KCP73_16365 [Salmonella enterica subsp. enterica]|nr:hypothetical protein KCP73_16365 [Salmonella enterica subsp. enterica]